jgi:hypothetical protein
VSFTNVFYRVPAATLADEILPAFRRALDERSIAPLLPYLDVERVRADWGCDPTVEVRTRGLLKKTQVARFEPSPGLLLGATVARDDRGYDVDKLLYHLRQHTKLLGEDDWARWDELLGWGHNLPDLFQDEDGPYGVISSQELPAFIGILRRLATQLGDDQERNGDRADVERLCDYLAATEPSDGVLVYTG